MFTTVDNVKLCAITTALPSAYVEFPLPTNSRRGFSTTGVQGAHIAPKEMKTSDLAYHAALKLMDIAKWSPESVDGIILLTQTPDFCVPATACYLQDRLGMRTSTIAFDVNLACSGFVYGLMLAGNLLSPQVKKVILLTGDLSSQLIDEQDDALNRLFGDAVCATALEYEPSVPSLHFMLGTDGAGYDSLVAPIRPAKSFQELSEKQYTMKMDGLEIFNFAIHAVPSIVNELLNTLTWSKESVDYWIMHQASKLILDSLKDKLCISQEKFLESYQSYGNTSSASIPLTMTQVLSKRDTGKTQNKRFLFTGFGAGKSFASCALECVNEIKMASVFVEES